MKILFNPRKTTKFKTWHKIGLIVFLVFFTAKVFAIPFLLWPALGALGYIFTFGNTSDVSDSSGGIFEKMDSVGGDIFYKFYTGLDSWLYTIYTGFGDVVLALSYTAFGIAWTLLGLSYYIPSKLPNAAERAFKFILGAVIMISFVESYELFEYWILGSLLDIQVVILTVLLELPPQILNIADRGEMLATAFFARVDYVFIEIFDSLASFKEAISSDLTNFELDRWVVLFVSIGAYGVLYAIYFVLIMIGFFGFFLLMGFAPIVFFISLFHKPLLSSWIKTSMNYYLIPIITAAVMSMSISFLQTSIKVAVDLENAENALFSIEFVMLLTTAIFSIAFHWKASEIAAGLTGGIVSSAGSVVGTAAAVGAGGWGVTKYLGGKAGGVGGFGGGGGGNIAAAAANGRLGPGTLSHFDKYRQGGRSMP